MAKRALALFYDEASLRSVVNRLNEAADIDREDIRLVCTNPKNYQEIVTYSEPFEPRFADKLWSRFGVTGDYRRYYSDHLGAGAVVLSILFPDHKESQVVNILNAAGLSPTNRQLISGTSAAGRMGNNYAIFPAEMATAAAAMDETIPNDLEFTRDFDSLAEDYRRMKGWDVVDPDSKKVGHVENLVISRGTSIPYFAVVDCGGFLRDELVPIPFGQITIDSDRKKLRIPYTKEQIKNAPEIRKKGQTDYVAWHHYWANLVPEEATARK